MKDQYSNSLNFEIQSPCLGVSFYIKPKRLTINKNDFLIDQQAIAQTLWIVDCITCCGFVKMLWTYWCQLPSADPVVGFLFVVKHVQQVVQQVEVMEFEHMSCVELALGGLNFISRGGWQVLWRYWLGGRKGIRPVKNRVVGYWRGYLSGAWCRLAHGPADATATHCLLLQ